MAEAQRTGEPSRAEPARLGIVVVTFGAAELLNANLAAIDTSILDAEVVVVDNFHSLEQRKAISAISKQHNWSMLAMPTNEGFGAAANEGVRYAETLGCTAFLLLNPDARICAETVAALWRVCESAPLTMLSPRIVRPDGSVWFRGGRLDARTGEVGHGDVGDGDAWLTGACLMVHSVLWRRLGGFDPDFFMYWEDVDLSRRCLDVGGQLRVCQELTAVHEVGGTQGGQKSPGYYYFNCRNRLLFAAKHLPAHRLLRWIFATPSASARVVLRGGRRALFTSPSIAWAGLRGSVAGLLVAFAALVRRT